MECVLFAVRDVQFNYSSLACVTQKLCAVRVKESYADYIGKPFLDQTRNSAVCRIKVLLIVVNKNLPACQVINTTNPVQSFTSRFCRYFSSLYA